MEKDSNFFEIEKLANQGNLDAQIYLGNAYELEKKWIKNSSEKAFYYFKLAADQGDVDACFKVGIYFFEGCSVQQSYTKAIEYFKIAAEQGFSEIQSEAHYNLGLCYERGWGISQSYEQAIYYYSLSAKQGNLSAQEKIKESQEDLVKIFNEQRSIFIQNQEAADHGSLQAQKTIAISYENGVAVLSDQEKAFYYFKLAADQGDRESIEEIAERYFFGEGTKVSLIESLHYLLKAFAKVGKMQKNSRILLKKATRQNLYASDIFELFKAYADRGNAKGQYITARCYAIGNGTKPSPEHAFEYYSLASEKNIKALIELAKCYFNGWGVDASISTGEILMNRAFIKNSIFVPIKYLSRSFSYYQKAICKGQIEAIVPLGYCYEEGLEIICSKEKALQCYQLGMQLGIAPAYYKMGECYELGKICLQSFEKAAEYYKIGADKKDVQALCALGRLYFYGRGVEQSNEKSQEHFRLAADLGHPPSQFNLALYFANGARDQKDISLALHYYRLFSQFKSFKEILETWQISQEADEATLSAFFTILKHIAIQGNFLAQREVARGFSLGIGTSRSEKNASYFYELAANQGDIEAQEEVIKRYFFGIGFTQSLEKALAYLKINEESRRHFSDNNFTLKTSLSKEKIISLEETFHIFKMYADHGNPIAQYLLSWFYSSYNRGAYFSPEQAFHYYYLSATQGKPEAQKAIADCYYHGYGIKRCLEKAFQYYKLAADKGHAEAQAALAHHYLEVEKSIPMTLHYFKMAADQNHLHSLLWLGNFYSKKKNKYEEPHADFNYYLKAAECGSSEAQLRIGIYFEEGENLPESLFNEERFAQAVKHYQLSSQQNNIEALKRLSNCYKKGRGVERSDAQAINCLEQATMLGDSSALVEVGIHYAKGDYLIRDEVKAARYFQTAALKGNAKAKACLGICYEKGRGVKKDLEKAFSFYRQAAEQGDCLGQQHLGRFYEYGIVSEHSPKQAFHYYELAANQGSVIGFFKLGWCYENGIGVEKNESLAFQWYSRAAEFGYVGATYHLGICYECGIGVAQDPKMAFYYFEKAAAKGNIAAVEKIAQCFSEGNGIEKSEEHLRKYNNYSSWLEKEQEEVEDMDIL